MMKPKNKPKQVQGFSVLILTGKDAERFIHQDQVPLTKKQKDYLKECLELYLKNPIKWDKNDERI